MTGYEFDPYRYSEPAQVVLAHSVKIAERNGHTLIDAEHILYALIEQPDELMSQLFKMLSLDLTGLRVRLEENLRMRTNPHLIFGSGRRSYELYITPAVNRIIQNAEKEAERRKALRVGPEHIFLAILSAGTMLGRPVTPSARILKEAGISLKDLGKIVDEALKSQSTHELTEETGQ